MVKFVRRRGMSVFALGILFVLAMALLQGAQYFFLESVSDHSERLVIRQHAETLAQSAIAEALARITVEVNQPGNELYDQLRGPLAEGRTYSTVLPATTLGRVTAMLTDPENRGISLRDLELTIERHGRIDPFDPMTYEGVITLRSDVRTGGPLSDGRRHEVSKGFKVLQVVPMYPIGARPLTVIRPIAVLTQPADLNKVIAEWRQTRMTNLRDVFERFIAKLEEAAQKAGEQVTAAEQQQGQPPGGQGGQGGQGPTGATPDQLQQQISQGKQAQGILTRVIEIYRELLGPNGYITQTETILADFVPFPDPRDSVLVARNAAVPIEELEVQRRFVPLLQRSYGEYAKYKALNDKVSQTLQSDEPSRDESLYRAHVDALFTYLDTVVQAKGEVSRFQSQFEMLDPASTEAMRLKYDSVDPARAVKFSHLNTSSCVLLVEGNGLDVSGQLTELMNRLKRSGSGLHGNVFVRNPSQALILSGELTGKMTIFVSGGVEIQGLRKGTPESVITVVASGANPVRLSGLIQASLVTHGTNLDLSGAPQLEGSLTMMEWFPQSTYAGTATLDPAAPSPADPSMRHVAISPWTRSRTFEEL